MNKGGRPRDPVWIHFDEVSKDGKSYARCKKCCHELFSKVGRMKAHNQVLPRQCLQHSGGVQSKDVALMRNSQTLLITYLAVQLHQLQLKEFSAILPLCTLKCAIVLALKRLQI